MSMITTKTRNVLPVLLSLALFTALSATLTGFQADSGGRTQPAPLSTSDLRALVAPIALYPDNLVAIVLASATFPDQVAIADYWLEQNKDLTGGALEQAVNKQSWDA